MFVDSKTECYLKWIYRQNKIFRNNIGVGKLTNFLINMKDKTNLKLKKKNYVLNLNFSNKKIKKQKYRFQLLMCLPKCAGKIISCL